MRFQKKSFEYAAPPLPIVDPRDWLSDQKPGDYKMYGQHINCPWQWPCDWLSVGDAHCIRSGLWISRCMRRIDLPSRQSVSHFYRSSPSVHPPNKARVNPTCPYANSLPSPPLSAPPLLSSRLFKPMLVAPMLTSAPECQTSIRKLRCENILNDLLELH